jgi:hypothetical protein
MPFVRVPNAALVEVRMLLDGQHIENTLWFQSDTAPTGATLATLADAIGAWWIANYRTNVSSAVSLVEVVATSMDSATAPTATFVPGTPQSGTGDSEALPNNVSLTVSFRTESRGRSFRGRNYITGLTDAQVANNTVDPLIVADWIDAYEAVGTAVSGTGFTWVVASRFSGVDANGDPIPRDPGITTPITAVVIVDPIIDSQRRRLPGRGR